MIVTDIRRITGAAGTTTFRRFTALTVLSSGLQVAAVVLLIPLLHHLFDRDAAGAGPWTAALVAVTAAIWMIERSAAGTGVELGLHAMRAVGRHGVRAIRDTPLEELTPARKSELRSLIGGGGIELTSMVVLLITPILTAVSFTCFLAVALLFIDWRLAPVTIAGAVLLLGAVLLSERIERGADDAFTGATLELDERLVEFAVAQPALRTAGRVERGSTHVDDAVAGGVRAVRRLLLWQIPGQMLTSTALQLTLLGFGAATWLAYDDGRLDGVEAAVMVIVLMRVIEQITAVSMLASSLHTVGATLRQLRELVERPTTVPGRRPAPGVIRARGIGVTRPDGTVAVTGVDLDLEPGTTTVIVGASGCGKSTLLDVLAGLVEPTTGTVSVGERPVSAADRRAMTTAVFQDTVLGNTTIRDNLRITGPELDEVISAAQLDSVPGSSGDGPDMRVGESGNRLSGGERQRVGIARALAAPGDLLVIDEATANLDALNERAIVSSLARVKGRRTTVVVTHRPAVLEIADRVVVMSEGRIVESGTREELSAAGGIFARMERQWRNVRDWRV